MLASALALASSGVEPVPPATPCTLHVAPVPTRPLTPELLRLAPQYFHPAYRGLFLDVIKGTSRYAYYDPADPFTRSAPPEPLASVEFVTPHFLVGNGSGPSWKTVVFNKETRAAVVVRAKWLHVDDVLETPDRVLWILGEQVDSITRRPGSLLLLRGDNSLRPQTLSRNSERSWWTSRLGITKSGQLAVAWVEGGAGTGGKVSLRLAWTDATGTRTGRRRRRDRATSELRQSLGPNQDESRAQPRW